MVISLSCVLTTIWYKNRRFNVTLDSIIGRTEVQREILAPILEVSSQLKYHSYTYRPINRPVFSVTLIIYKNTFIASQKHVTFRSGSTQEVSKCRLPTPNGMRPMNWRFLNNNLSYRQHNCQWNPELTPNVFGYAQSSPLFLMRGINQHSIATVVYRFGGRIRLAPL